MINQKLKELRKQKGLSQEDVAKALSVQQHTYSGWETGRHQISVDKIPAICNFYNVEPAELFSNTINQTFNDKVQNGYIHNVENMYSEATETIALIKQQNEMLHQTVNLLAHQLNTFAEFVKNSKK